MKKGGLAICFGLMLSYAAARALATTLCFAWDPSPTTTNSAAIGGYCIYWGPASLTYTNVLDAGNNTNVCISNLVAGARYYFAATAYDTNGLVSDFSNEITWPTSQLYRLVIAWPKAQTQ